jgi:hypothetical protein
MITKLLAVACLVVATVLTAVATASPVAKKQRIAITAPGGNTDRFVLAPLTHSPLAHDSGTASSCCWTRRFTTRDGQSIETDAPVIRTFSGKHGTFTWRASIDWVDAGNGYLVGTGTWRIVRGTGVYTHLEGNGRIALSSPPEGSGSARAEGLVDLGK